MDRKKNIIIIDDDQLSNFLFKETIQLIVKNAEISDFTEPCTALEYISAAGVQQNGPVRNILFLDLNMPFMTGWEALEKFYELDQSIKDSYEIFMISSSIDPADEKRAASIPGIKGFLVKPLTEEAVERIFLNVA